MLYCWDGWVTRLNAMKAGMATSKMPMKIQVVLLSSSVHKANVIFDVSIYFQWMISRNVQETDGTMKGTGLDSNYEWKEKGTLDTYQEGSFSTISKAGCVKGLFLPFVSRDRIFNVAICPHGGEFFRSRSDRLDNSLTNRMVTELYLTEWRNNN